MKDQSREQDQDTTRMEVYLQNTLKPRQADWNVDRKILEDLLLKDPKTISRERWSSVFRYGWFASLGAIAAIVLTFLFFLQTDPDTSGGNELNPIPFGPVTYSNPSRTVQYRAIKTQNQLVGVENKGWSEGNEDSVTREMEYQYIDTVDLISEEDGSVVRLQVPRQEIVKVTYQVI